MIEIVNSSSPNVTKSISFQKVRFGRKHTFYIEARQLDGSESDEQLPTVNIPATGDMQLQDIPEFIKAVKLAAMIASGELEIE